MTPVDYLILGIVVVSALIGMFRGFIPEILGLVTWIAAVYIGWNFSSLIEPSLSGKIGSPAVELWASRFIVFAAVLIVGGLLGQILALMIERTGLSGTDRSLGFAFGIVRGFVVLGIIVILAQLLSLQGERWWQQSQLMPFAEGVAKIVREVLPDEIGERIAPVEAEGEPANDATAPDGADDGDTADAVPSVG